MSVPEPYQDLIILHGRSEVESDLLRQLLEDSGIETFHVPSAESALMGRPSRIRFAIRSTDREQAEEILDQAAMKLADFQAVRSAYNLDEPFHHVFSRWRMRFSWGVVLWIAALLLLLAYFAARGR